MGERVSIQFAKLEQYGNRTPEQEKSVCLFNHFGATKFPIFAFQWVQAFYNHTRQYVQPNFSDSFSRFDVIVLMPQFVMAMGRSNQFDHYKYEGVFSDNLYFGKDEKDGDNRDHGHHLIIVPNHELPYNQDSSDPFYNPKYFTMRVQKLDYC